MRTGIRAPAPIDLKGPLVMSPEVFARAERILRPTVPPGCTSGYAERTADKLTIELLRAYNLANGREARVFDATQVARTWVRRLLTDAEQIAAAEGTQGAARLRAMGS